MTDGYLFDDGGRSAAGFKGRAGDCVTRAIAIASGMPYADVYAAMAHGNATERITKRSTAASDGKRTAAHGIRVQRKWFKDWMRDHGFVWTPTMIVGAGTTVHLIAAELPAGRLVVRVSKHITTMIDGVVHDTYDPRRSTSWKFEPDYGQELKPNQRRVSNVMYQGRGGIETTIGGRAVYGYWEYLG